MLNEKQTKEFLALLLAFAMNTGASGRNLSDLFGVTVKTMARWLVAARGEEKASRMYHSRVAPIARAIERMNDYNTRVSVYADIQRISSPSKRVEALKHLRASV